MRPPRHNRRDPEESSDEQRIRAAAVALLARREHSRHELAQKLEQRGYDTDVCARVIEDLVRRRLVSDERFVGSFVTHRASRGQGPVRIRAELRELGIDAELIERALDAADVDWAGLAVTTRRRRFGTAAPRDFTERAKQARFLQYRGFTLEQIRPALGVDHGDGGEISP